MKIDNKENNFPLYLFWWKNLVDSFLCLSVFISIKKKELKGKIFFIKIKSITYF